MKLSENKLRGIFWGGMVGGLGSCLPLLSMANCICCLWAWFTGAMAVALIRKREPLDDKEAPKMGALAGAFAGLVSSTGQLLFSLIAGSSLESRLVDIQGYLPNTFPEESFQAFEGIANSGMAAVIFHLFSAIFLMVIFALFGALGSLLYVRLIGPKPVVSQDANDIEAIEQE